MMWNTKTMMKLSKIMLGFSELRGDGSKCLWRQGNAEIGGQ